MSSLTYGHKGDVAYENTGNGLLEFFSKAGSLMKKRGTYHGKAVSLTHLFKDAWYDDPYKAMQLALWLRDCRRGTEGRAGAGNRSGAMKVFNWVANNEPEWIKANLDFIPKVGRWKDFIAFIDTPCENEAMQCWSDAISLGDGLANKWTPREKSNKKVFHKLRKMLKMSPPQFRKHLSKNTQVVETPICNKTWGKINYSHVPSVAMARYVNTFTKHDTNRFQEWKTSLKDPNSSSKVNAEVLFPHDCIRTLKAELGVGNGYYEWSTRRSFTGEEYGESEVANAQFDALPNYMEGTNMRIMPICDFSGSMAMVNISGIIDAIDISMAMGLYCSDRVGEDNPFYRKFIPFSDNARLVDWKDDSFSVAVQKYNDGYCMSTNVSAALDSILDSAKLFKATDEQMPNCLLILSDMQFDPGGNRGKTAIEACLDKWEEAGYSKPVIVYWNLGDSDTSPATSESENVVLVSGFSPALLTAILEGDDFSPIGVMERAISKYEIIDPRF